MIKHGTRLSNNEHPHGGKWKTVEFYFRQTDEYEIPVYAEDKAYLDKAKEYLDVNDYKAMCGLSSDSI